MKLSPQHRKILNYLEGGEWKCITTANLFIKDERKRLSELRDKGYNIVGERCDGRCGVKHSANILMRKWVKTPPLFRYEQVGANTVRQVRV